MPCLLPPSRRTCVYVPLDLSMRRHQRQLQPHYVGHVGSAQDLKGGERKAARRAWAVQGAPFRHVQRCSRHGQAERPDSLPQRPHAGSATQHPASTHLEQQRLQQRLESVVPGEAVHVAAVPVAENQLQARGAQGWSGASCKAEHTHIRRTLAATRRPAGRPSPAQPTMMALAPGLNAFWLPSRPPIQALLARCTSSVGAGGRCTGGGRAGGWAG